MAQVFEPVAVDLGDLPSGVSSLLAYGDKLVVGTSSGAILVYSVNDPFSRNIKGKVVATVKGLTKRSIDQLAIVKDAGFLIALADGLVHVIDLDSYSPVETLQGLKGGSVVAAREGVSEVDNGVHAVVSRLAVASRKRLLVYEWRDSQFETVKEIQLNDRIRTMSFVGLNRIVCGLSTDFALVDVELEQVVSTVVASSNGSESSQSFSSSVGSLSYIGLGLGSNPAPLTLEVADSKCLLVRNSVGQFVDADGSLLPSQTAPKWPAHPTRLAFVSPYLISVINNDIVEVRSSETGFLFQSIAFPGTISDVTNGKLLYAANSQGVVKRFLVTDYDKQIDRLVKNDNLTEAISLLTLLEPVLIKDKEARLRDLHILNATQMFKSKKYQDALQLFSDVSAPPDAVIGLYPPVISGTSITNGSENGQNGSSAHAEHPKDGDQQQDQGEPSRSNSLVSSEDLMAATAALQPYLADTRRKIATLNAREEQITYQGFELSREIYGDLEKAAVLVDTTLFRCYILRSPSLVGSLVRVQNQCDPIVVEAELTRKKMWRELIDFYYGKSLHRKALALLHDLATTESSILSGPEPTIQYLKRLGNEHVDLIFEFSKWPISCDKQLGVELFIDDDELVDDDHSLPRSKVLSFLQSLQDPDQELVIKFLSHAISLHNDTSANIHTSLALAYVQAIDNGDKQGLWDDFIKFMKTSQHYRPDRVLNELPNTDKFLVPRAILHGKKGEHEQALKIYAFELDDSHLAELYCAELYKKDSAAGRESLHTLLSLYMTKRNTDLVIHLLSSQGSRMSMVKVIKMLDSEMKISDLDGFLQSQLRRLQSRGRAYQLDSSLRKVDLVRAEEELLELGTRHTTITNLRTCQVCAKRLGHSVISIFPDGAVVHYGCSNAYKEAQESEKKRLQVVRVSQYQSQ